MWLNRILIISCFNMLVSDNCLIIITKLKTLRSALRGQSRKITAANQLLHHASCDDIEFLMGVIVRKFPFKKHATGGYDLACWAFLPQTLPHLRTPTYYILRGNLAIFTRLNNIINRAIRFWLRRLFISICSINEFWLILCDSSIRKPHHPEPLIIKSMSLNI